MFNVGDKVKFNSHACTVTRVFKNGYLAIECWVEAFGMVKPKLMKFRVKSKFVEAV